MGRSAGKVTSTKPAAFQKQGKGVQPTVTPDILHPGKQMLANIKQLADNYGKPRDAKVITTDPKNYNKQQLENIKRWAASMGGQGDNPFKDA